MMMNNDQNEGNLNSMFSSMETSSSVDSMLRMKTCLPEPTIADKLEMYIDSLAVGIWVKVSVLRFA